MFSFLKTKKGKDKEISLIIENEAQEKPFVVKVYRSSLVKYSAVFKKMSEKGEFKGSKEIKLKGITETGLQKIIQYIQSECVFFKDHFEAIETLRVAFIYQIEAMNDICSNFLITAIQADNVCDIYEFASSYTFPLVEYHCLKYIDEHAEDVLKSSAFLTLKKPTVMDIIKRQSLNISSETFVFKAVLTWGLNDCLRRNLDADNAAEVLKSVKPLLSYVRFYIMSEAELSDPEVGKFYKLLCSEDATKEKRRSSLISLESKSTRSNTADSTNMQPRAYLQDYEFELEIVDCDEHAIKNSEIFCLRIDVLKGSVFLTGVTLAFDRFVATKNSSCLYVAVSATNVKTADQVCARGAFMMSGEVAAVTFPQPLIVRECENVELALKVKRAVNICSMKIKSDSQIAISDSKDVAMKIMPCSATGGTERSMFKGIQYFY